MAAMLEIVNDEPPAPAADPQGALAHAEGLAMLRQLVEQNAAPPPAPVQAPPDRHAQLLGVMNLLATLLTVRLALVLAVLGSFILAVLVVPNPQPGALWALGIFCSSLIPLSWLVSRRVS